MRILFAYICVIAIWATTPLAIKWSGEGTGFLFGVLGRMTIGGICLLFIHVICRKKLVWHGKALLTYLAVALQIYGAMIAVYWGAQFIPSGWISVIFGLTPLLTALIAACWRQEKNLSIGKLFSYFLGIAGLYVMFASAIQISRQAVFAIMAILLSAFIQAFSSVLIKQINAKLPALSQTTGGLLIAVPLYFMTWGLTTGRWPNSISDTTLLSIIYLGLIATPIGFVLYYYLLTHLAATRVSLITLVTPVLSLLIGYTINHEPFTSKLAIGTGCILGALILHEFFYHIGSGFIFQKR